MVAYIGIGFKGIAMTLNKKKIVIGLLVAGGLVYAIPKLSEERDESRVQSQEKKQVNLVSVITAEVKSVPMRDWVTAYGNARAQRREYMTFEGQGRVIMIALNEKGGVLREGDAVKKGQVLARLESVSEVAALEIAKLSEEESGEQLRVAEATVKQMVSRETLSRKQFDRETSLYKSEATSKENFEKAESGLRDAELNRSVAEAKLRAAKATLASKGAKVSQAKKDLAKMEIVSAIDGVVAYKNLKVGWLFSSKNVNTKTEETMLNSIPFVIIQEDQFEVILDVPSFQAAEIKQGQKAKLFLTVDESDRVFKQGEQQSQRVGGIEAEVYTVNPAVNPGNRTMRVRLHAEDAGDLLKDGMHVTCQILVSEKEAAASLPLAAVVYQDHEAFVFLVGEGGKAERVVVELGIRTNDRVEILSPVIDKAVVVRGQMNLYQGAGVKVVTGVEGK